MGTADSVIGLGWLALRETETVGSTGWPVPMRGAGLSAAVVVLRRIGFVGKWWICLFS